MSSPSRPGPTLVDFVEGYTGSSAEEIIERADQGRAVVADPREMLDLLEQQRLDGSGPELRPGELRPIIGHSIADIASGGVELERPGQNGHHGSEGFSLDVRSLLLYAHSVSIADPFAPSVVIGGPVGGAIVADDHRSVAGVAQYGIEVVCRLAPLIRNGVVFVAPPVPAPAAADSRRASRQLQDVIPRVALELVRVSAFRFTDQSDLYLRARTIAERFLRQEDLLGSLGQRGTRLISCEAESAALPTLAELRSEHAEEGPDRWTLTELMRLRLQGAGRLRMADMISVRDDASFTVFRDDIERAVSASAKAEPNGDVTRMASVVADEMRGAAERLDIGTRRSAVLSATLGDVLGWAVGTGVGAVADGWRGVGIAAATNAVVALGADAPRESRRALRRHYVELSHPPDASPKTRARDQLRSRRTGAP